MTGNKSLEGIYKLQQALELENSYRKDAQLNKALIIDACNKSTQELNLLDESINKLKHFKKNSFNSFTNLEDILNVHRIHYSFCVREWNINNKFWTRAERIEVLTLINSFEMLILQLTQKIRIVTLSNSEYRVKL
jgi:hypothetical protein